MFGTYLSWAVTLLALPPILRGKFVGWGTGRARGESLGSLQLYRNRRRRMYRNGGSGEMKAGFCLRSAEERRSSTVGAAIGAWWLVVVVAVVVSCFLPGSVSRRNAAGGRPAAPRLGKWGRGRRNELALGNGNVHHYPHVTDGASFIDKIRKDVSLGCCLQTCCYFMPTPSRQYFIHL